MESRLTEIEIKLALTEDLVETLNLTVHRQQEQIDALQRQLLALAKQVHSTSASTAEPHSLRDEIPPHY
ncbi:MAG TPA: SlyX family protein [Zoogloea sp.]|uniref:SlyX family protein n=1 Tax=Zoogloea sp. TaxID=49181 RepID=UPI002BE77AA8|nr:SlyX family protein [Zoogloea sp.]HMV18935.1 SlyX family protein [Rhodocyclaceae bacterium]HMV63159.1 SlyX family protein [Rhodocyclaceae bacterium]HMW52428.1 SlyX family protein [Rhodocyclaceae bacterium]HMY49151.1 SlyX family protein [Rhodocyclaceae bacterium]HMZ76088.1 SlyX family protein [Rhodocyclaceae bacterium]